MKTFNQLLAGIILSVSAFTTCGNELTNGGFELSPPTAYGNNIGYTVAPWGFTGTTTSNVVHVDGPGGSTGYGSNGPASDATNSGAGVWRNYLDATDASGKIYQSFTTPEECSGDVRFGGFFSTRANQTGYASLKILTGSGLSGALVGTTANVSVVGGNSRTDPWTPVNFVTTLTAGTTYTLVIDMDNQLNFDEGYVNFVDGPCKDDSDLDEDEPKQCLVLEPKVECVANKWQVSITNSSSSFNADVLEITSLTSGVTISGSSPNWILNGALPNSSVDITVDGTVTGGGKEDFADLCCTTKLHIDIPDEECEIIQEKPHLYTRKGYGVKEDGKGEFRLLLDIFTQLDSPLKLTITDTIPAGVTLTSLNSSNASNWSCPGMPIAGPATLVCTYIGPMPIAAATSFMVLINADVTPSEDPRENCITTTLIDGDGVGVPYDGIRKGCADIPPVGSDCLLPYILIEGHCELPCQEDSECSSIEGGACLPFYNTETLVCQQSDDLECGEGEVLVDGECVSDVPLACNSNIIIVADESASIKIAGDSSKVSNAIRSFAKGFKGNGSKAAVIHFDTNAELVRPMTDIGSAPGAPTQENYFASFYSPTIGQTNWEAGLKLALAEVTTTPGSIVFFITDGQPNHYLDAAGNTQAGTEALSVSEAVTVANLIKAEGSRIIAIGVGDISGSSTAQSNLNSIASSSSDTVMDDIANLNQIAIDYATQACPDIYLNKETVSGQVTTLPVGETTTNVKPEFKITVTNNTAIPLTGIEVQDALPMPHLTFWSFSAGTPTNGVVGQTANIIKWSGISLAPAATATLKYRVNVVMQGPNKVYNYAQVTAVDQPVSSVIPLANAKSGPLNPDDKDEGRDFVQLYTSGPPSVPCAPTETDPDYCLRVYKTMVVENEGDCLPGAPCKYKIQISNTSNQPYTGALNLSDSFTPTSSSAITVIPSGSAPNPMCTPSPTSIPFSCVQNTDLPAYGFWIYTITTVTPASGISKNCFKVNSKSDCAPHPSSTKSLQVDIEDEEIIEIDKFAPRTCKAGGKCDFIFTLTNKGKKTYKAPITIIDKPRKKFGRIRFKSKGWSCKKRGREYRCSIKELLLKPGESRKVKLKLQVPKKLSGKVENCASIKADHPVSPPSCVTVDIINDRQCGYDDKRVGGQCIPHCKSKKSHWNGVDCMVCRNGSVWNDRYKRCDKKPKEVLIKSCPSHYKWSNAQKRCVYYVPKESGCGKNKRWDTRVRKCVSTLPPRCNKGTHYDATEKRCVENRVSKPKACNKGTHYDAAKKRCVENRVSKPKGCPKGQIYLSDLKRCVKVKKKHPKKGGASSCGDGEIWNILYKKCDEWIEPSDGGDDDDGGGHP